MTDEHRSPSQLNEWRPVEGYEGFYEVSDMGSIRSLDRTVDGPRGPQAIKGKRIKCPIGVSGYRQVSLRKRGRSWTTKVHRLVAKAFVSNPLGMPYVCHRDGDRLNNLAANLYYGSNSDNMRDRLKHGKDTNANKTHCVNGHQFSKDNTYIHNNTRSCKECRRESSRRFRGKKNAIG